jgi:hypothetical protein
MAFDNEPAGLPSHPEQPGRVFISYAAEDREKARRLGEYLGACGWQIWSDRNIPAGRAYDESIEEALRQSACVVVLWSRAAVNSRWVRSEASEGASRDVLVPALLEEVTIPLEFRLLPAVDLRSWDGSNDDVRLANVDEAIRQITNVVPATPDVSLSPEIARPPGRAARSIAVRSSRRCCCSSCWPEASGGGMRSIASTPSTLPMSRSGGVFPKASGG